MSDLLHIEVSPPAENCSSEAQAKHDYLVSTPMWNYSVPSVLKAWIDQIIVPGTTKVTGKVTVIISHGGSYVEGAPRAGWDWQG